VKSRVSTPGTAACPQRVVREEPPLLGYSEDSKYLNLEFLIFDRINKIYKIKSLNNPVNPVNLV
jgi:hypothetical protein